MICSVSRFTAVLLSSAVLIAMSAFPAFMQEDPDPNSPTPVLLSIEQTRRALALPMRRSGKYDLRNVQPTAFGPNSKVVLFISSLPLMKDEGVGAFRVYSQDSEGHQYRFPVVDLQPSTTAKDVLELTVELRDELRYFDPPSPTGDLLIQVSWRGLISNQLRLGYGKMGGRFQSETTVGKLNTGVISPGLNSLIQSDPTQNYIGNKWSGDRMRFLEQATFGPTDALDARIRRIGIRTWLAEQFSQPYPSAANPYPDIPLKPSGAPADCDGSGTDDVPATCFRDSYTMYPVQTWFYREAFYGEPQLRHRVTFALSQIWVISGVNTQQSSHMITYHQVLSRNAFGNWRQLMGEMTLNPAMGNYLDMIRSTKNNPNENYPREIMQLFNVGLFMLNPDGTLQLDGQSNPIPTYDQAVVTNLTKVFTGWRDCISSLGTCPNSVLGTVDYKDPMVLNTNNHDLTAKTLLSYPGSTTTNIPACAAPCSTVADRSTYANNSLNQALDNIYNHPNVAPFVSKHLIQALVTSDPTPAYVGRISAVFNANRTSPTQMQEVVRAILLDPEARGDVKSDPNYGKLREPVLLATNLMRQFNVTGAPGFPTSDGNLNSDIPNLGENVFNSPTVFNFFPPDYVVPGAGIPGPEFAIFNTGTAVGRANMVNRYVMSVPGGRGTSSPDFPSGTSLNFADAIAAAAADTTGNRLLDYLSRKLMHGTLSAQMRSTILPAVTAIASSDPTTRARAAIYLVVTSSQFQVQR